MCTTALHDLSTGKSASVICENVKSFMRCMRIIAPWDSPPPSCALLMLVGGKEAMQKLVQPKVCDAQMSARTGAS
jgi:hypothetical protein